MNKYLYFVIFLINILSGINVMILFLRSYYEKFFLFKNEQIMVLEYFNIFIFIFFTLVLSIIVLFYSFLFYMFILLIHQ